MTGILIIIAIGVVIFIGLVILLIIDGKKEEKIDKLCIQELEQQGVHFDFLTKVQSGYIGMDQKAKNLIFTERNSSKPKFKIFNFEDIYSCELLSNNTIVSKKSTARTIGGAIIGEAIGGRGGMIVGGLSGGTHSKNVTSLIELKIVVKDLESPTHKITIYDRNKYEYERLSSEAEKWNARINLIIDQIDLEYAASQKEADTPHEDNNSVADELAKLHELKQKGILTEEEFNAQKKKVLDL